MYCPCGFRRALKYKACVGHTPQGDTYALTPSRDTHGEWALGSLHTADGYRETAKSCGSWKRETKIYWWVKNYHQVFDSVFLGVPSARKLFPRWWCNSELLRTSFKAKRTQSKNTLFQSDEHLPPAFGNVSSYFKLWCVHTGTQFRRTWCLSHSRQGWVNTLLQICVVFVQISHLNIFLWDAKCSDSWKHKCKISCFQKGIK